MKLPYEHIEDILTNNDLTYEQLGVKLGVSLQTVYCWGKYEDKPIGYRYAFILSRMYNIPVEELLNKKQMGL